MLHEFGHFFAAKRSGMKVTEFFVGFGPRIWSFTRGETEYGVKAVPRRLLPHHRHDQPRRGRARRRRAARTARRGTSPGVIVAAAGPAVHFVIAFVLMFSVLFVAGDAAHEQRVDEARRGRRSARRPRACRPATRSSRSTGTRSRTGTQVAGLIAARRHRPATRSRSSCDRGDATSLAKCGSRSRAPTRTGQKPRSSRASRRRVVVPHPGLFGAIADGARAGRRRSAWDAVKALGQIFSPSGISNYFHVLAGTTRARPTNQTALPVAGRLRAGRATTR